MRSWFMHARESFWFLPTVFGLVAIGLALALIELDRLLLAGNTVSVPLITQLSPTGGRAILTVVGGTMLGVAATSFSITISVLATTSSTYGPRLVRNFMADRGNQVVLAVLTSTFLYTLVVLRAVRTEQDSTSAFVPVIAVSFTAVLAICDVAVLVYFIHHIASSVQVTTLQGRVLAELTAVIDLLYPQKPRPAVEESPAEGDLDVQQMFCASASGYVQYVDIDALVESAEDAQGVIQVLTPPGSHVLAGHPVARLLATRTPEASPADAEKRRDARAEDVSSAIVIGPSRTPRQDLRFAAQGLVETGIRGLASGTNDPYTAVTAIDTLSSALVTLFTRPPAVRAVPGADGRLRLLCHWPAPDQVLSDALLALRTYGMQHPLVVEATLRLIARIEAVAVGGDRIMLRDEVDAVRTAYLATSPAKIDAVPMLRALDEVRDRLTGLPSEKR